MEQQSDQQQNQHDQPAVGQNETKIQRIKTRCLPGVKITLIISIILSLISFIIGIWGVHKCPVEDNIPFFLIVIGGIGVISKVLTFAREKLVKINDKTQYIMSVLYTVEIVFLLNGSFWVFKVYKPDFTGNGEHYCSKTVYMFAFTYLFILYGMIMVLIFAFICFLACILCVVATADDDVEAQTQTETEPMRQ